MPYRRKYTKHANYRNLNRGMSTAVKALTIARGVRALVNTEWKSKRTTLPTTASTTPVLTNIFSIAQGDDYDDRQGNKVRVKSIRIDGSFSKHSSFSITRGRLMLIRDNMGSTTPPTITDLFNAANQFFWGGSRKDDPQTNSRFSTLWDKKFQMSNQGPQAGFLKLFKETDFHVTWTGTAASDEGKGALYLIQGSDEATNVPNINAYAMVKYLDN